MHTILKVHLLHFNEQELRELSRIGTRENLNKAPFGYQETPDHGKYGFKYLKKGLRTQYCYCAVRYTGSTLNV